MTHPVCSVDGCTKDARSRGLCGMHYKRLQRNGDFGTRNIRDHAPVCSVDGCTRPYAAKHYCKRHYNYYLRKAKEAGG